MKKILLCISALFLFSISMFSQSCPVGSELVGLEEFSSTANLTIAMGSGFFNDGSNDHFGVTDGSDIGGNPSGFSGSYFAAEDVDDSGGTGANPQVFTITFNIANFTNLTFSGQFAKTLSDNEFDDSDFVTVEASIDGGASQQLIEVEEVDDGDPFNQPSQIDGTQLTTAAQTFSSGITGTGSSLVITVSVGLNSGDETIAFDNFTICGTPLVATPVELTSFTATNNQKEIYLDWITASELNNSHFEIQHSIDGANFRAIDEVIGNGTTQEKQAYSYTHATPANGTNYYRLKQVDYDGAFEYSDIRVVEIKRAGKIVINPSAAIAEITIRLAETTGDNNQIGIYDMMGRTVMMSAFDGTLDAKTIDISNLEKGYYVVRVQAGSEVFTERFMKMVD